MGWVAFQASMRAAASGSAENTTTKYPMSRTPICSSEPTWSGVHDNCRPPPIRWEIRGSRGAVGSVVSAGSVANKDMKGPRFSHPGENPWKGEVSASELSGRIKKYPIFSGSSVSIPRPPRQSSPGSSDGPLPAGRSGTALLRPEHGHHVGPERRLAGGAAVEHVAARIDGQLHPAGVAGNRHLVDDQAGDEIGARQVVPAVDDQHLHLGVGGDGLAQVRAGLGGLDALFPVVADLVAQRIEAALDLPADHAGVEVDHGAGGGRDDGVEDGVVAAAVRRPGERVLLGDIAVVDGRDPALVAIELAQEGANLDPPAGTLDEGRVEAGVGGDLGDDAVDRGRVAAA